ncbi:chemotaxis protein CheB [Nibricoccus aquaticus]|uniref:protein-glutamate methylesterase n=1 Tax=Nibricoccus aquaticus TaxID=2576891 RepID=A0A290QB13_9BACT|nr:chemotaxis protein CheB [Nibricoccus aquaticus]ATC65885.1 chemotaxis protein CheB [Nibricoccus aquaticus]
MIVIGGSLGGSRALREILLRLPEDFSLPIAVVLHRHRDGDELLRDYIQRDCALPIVDVEDKIPVEAGRVFLCPPDYHLMLEDGCFSLSTDELVNFARPSIDALFESAAEWSGRAAIAVVLTGGGFDGAAGAKRIQERGGIVIVQDPKTAEGLWMPTAALNATKTRHVKSLEGIATALIRLAARRRRMS